MSGSLSLNLDLCAGITDPASLKRPCNHVTESLWPLPLWTVLRRELTPDEGSWLKTYHPRHSSGPPASTTRKDFCHKFEILKFNSQFWQRTMKWEGKRKRSNQTKNASSYVASHQNLPTTMPALGVSDGLMGRGDLNMGNFQELSKNSRFLPT
jgi:hypothetical protein